MYSVRYYLEKLRVAISKISKRFSNIRKAIDKALIEISKSKKYLNILKSSRELLFLDSLSLN